VGIADVVLAVWELEMDTFGSCEQRESGDAYIHFWVPRDAEQAHAILQNAGIKSRVVQVDMSFRCEESGKATNFKGAHLLFSPNDVSAATAALRAKKTLA
jgi:hypothetical protein